jgi:hypothetical protein
MNSLQLHAIKQCLTTLPANELRSLRTDITENLYSRLRSALLDADIGDNFTKEIKSIGWISRMLDVNNKDLIKFIGSVKVDNLVEEYTEAPVRRVIENHTIQLIICPKGSERPSPIYINIHHINKIIQVSWETTGVLVREGMITTHGKASRIPYIMFMLRNLPTLIDLCP